MRRTRSCCRWGRLWSDAPGLQSITSRRPRSLGDLASEKPGTILQKRKAPSTAPTIKWALQAVARLAGWTDTKRTGRIGWETLWKGWMKLEDMADGFKVALHMQGVTL